ncbi:MAG: hypothetical protein LBP89_01495 [Helicobacteraceae bacterium]|jgi:hypothetical protein|nr:hypothetical protein [Helicobacteraceae bacterium]
MSVNATEQKWLLKRRAKLALAESQEKPPSVPEQKPPSKRSLSRAIIYGLTLCPVIFIVEKPPIALCVILTGAITYFYIMRTRSEYGAAIVVGALTSVLGLVVLSVSYSFLTYFGITQDAWSVRSFSDAIFMSILYSVIFLITFGLRVAIYAAVMAWLLKAYFDEMNKKRL